MNDSKKETWLFAKETQNDLQKVLKGAQNEEIQEDPPGGGAHPGDILSPTERVIFSRGSSSDALSSALAG